MAQPLEKLAHTPMHNSNASLHYPVKYWYSETYNNISKVAQLTLYVSKGQLLIKVADKIYVTQTIKKLRTMQ